MSAVQSHAEPVASQVHLLTESDKRHPMTDLFRRQVSLGPDRLAVIGSRQRWTYRELDQISDSIAQGLLRRCGPAPEPVALVLQHDAMMFAAFLAVIKSGHIVVALDPSHPVARLHSQIQAIGAKVILGDGPSAHITEHLTTHAHQVLSVESLANESASHSAFPKLTADQVMAITMTSGSTGIPKGVALDHINLMDRAMAFGRESQPRPGDRLAILTPLGIAAGMTFVFSAFLNGAALAPFNVASEGSDRLWCWLDQEGITILWIVPTVLRRLATAYGNDKPPSRLRHVRTGGEPLQSQDIAPIKKCLGPNCRLQVAYASTESGTISQMMIEDVEDVEEPDRLIPVGTPNPGYEVLIQDDQARTLPVGEIGRIVVRGRCMSRGYWGQPELTAATFLTDAADPGLLTYRMGDRGRLRPDGLLEVHGRWDDLVKVRGLRIELAEIETALRQLPNVKEAAAATFEPRPGEKKLVAYMVAHKPDRISIRDWRQALAQVLPGGLVPELFMILPELPINDMGKLNRPALPQPAPGLANHDGVIRPGRDSLEKTLVEIWEAVLGISPIGRDQDFFQLGGDSLLAAAVVARIEDALGTLPPLGMFLQAATVEEQALLLTNQSARIGHTLVALQTQGNRPPLYCVHNSGGEIFHFSHLAKRLGTDQPVYGLQTPALLGEWPPATFHALAQRHVREILAQDPTGPCSLIGLCVGGLLALEIARQLRQAGKPVQLVAMIDTFVTARSATGRSASFRKRQTDRIAQIFRNMRWFWLLAGHRLGITRDRRFTTGFRRFHAHTYMLAQARYKPERYPGPVVMFLAQGFTTKPDLRLQMCQDYFPQAQIRNIKGTHVTCLSPPVVDSLAAELGNCLSSAWDRSDGGTRPLMAGYDLA